MTDQEIEERKEFCRANVGVVLAMYKANDPEKWCRSGDAETAWELVEILWNMKPEHL